ncbi:MAG: metal ABC transporter ATP-binding protein [Lentisphaerae bacterium]|nr:metal ABC transporter ATP-binding protein [Lentisphaerota bacterium]
MSAILELDNVCVRRGGRTVLDHVSLILDQGELVALIGANGSGKTTFLRTVMGFLQPAIGTMSVFGQTGSNYRQLRKRIGYVPQAMSIDFKMPMTVRDVVSMGRFGLVGLGKRLGDVDRNAIEKAMADIGIDSLAERPIGHLSGGELQKVQIARALCQAPDLMLLDEPTSNLDLGAQHECLNLISRIHLERNLTTLIVMHDLKSLPEKCTRALIIDEARIVFDGGFRDVFTEDNLAHVYKQQDMAIFQELMTEFSRERGSA